MDSKSNDFSKGNIEIESKANSTFELLRQGETEICLNEKYKDLVLVLGNTGSGKSTFVQWIAGDDEQLISREVTEGTGDFGIVDQRRISNSTIESKTIFPELQIDAQTNTAFYDCPGFSDTRNTTIDISSTYFIKKLLDHARSVKLIFLINHSSVRKGVDRQDFMKLMKHNTDFLKNVDKYKNSIALIATKVDNNYRNYEGSIRLVPDEIIIGAIGDFIQEVEQDLQKRLEEPNISIKEQEFFRNAMKFIGILLVKQNSAHINIGIFRRPNKKGPLSKIPLMQEGKVKINNILHKQLSFTVKANDDFGYTISDKSKNEINDLVEEINKYVWSYGMNITEKVNLYYRGLTEQLRNEIKSLITNPNSFKFDPLEAQTFLSKFSSGKKTFSSLAEDIQNKSIEEMTVKINNTITSSGIQVPESYVLHMANAGKYFNFLKLVSGKELNTRQWGELFKDVLKYFSEFKNDIHNDVKEAAKHINKLLSDSKKNIHNYYDNKMKTLEIQRLPDELNKAVAVMQELKQKVEKNASYSELPQAIEKTDSLMKSLGLDIGRSNVVVIVNRNKYLSFLQILSGTNLISESLPWTCPFEDAVSYLTDSLNWYKYLNSLFSVLSEYKVQKNPSRYNVGDLDDWGKDEKLQGIVIVKSNFQKFLDKTAEFNIVESNSIKSIDVTESQLEELNNVLNIALRQKIQVRCEQPSVFITGEYIKTQDIIRIKNSRYDQNRNCWSSSHPDDFDRINVFALNTVFIDQHLPFSRLGLAITIISPKWEVIGSKEIDLHGYDGRSMRNEPSSGSSDCSGSNGKDGEPGFPGGAGGSFFGIAERIVNGNYLTINTSGGNGGSGSDGEDGHCGSDGTPAEEPGENTPCPDFCNGRSGCKVLSYYSNRYAAPPDIVTLYKYTYEILAKPGLMGGKGGDGGRGGEGGNPGDIVIVEMDGSSGVLKHKYIGSRGRNGVGGSGGKGGKTGGDLEMTCTLERTNSFGYVYEQTKWQRNKRTEETNLGSRGSGSNGANSKRQRSPESAYIIRRATLINEYKQYLRNNLNNRLKKFPLVNFLNRMDSIRNVRSISDTSSRNKREVGQVLQSSVHSTHRELWGTRNIATNSGEHLSSSINSLFKWFKKRSIAWVSSIVSIQKIDSITKPVYECDNWYMEAFGSETSFIEGEFNNDDDSYNKYKGSVGTFQKYNDLENQRTLEKSADRKSVTNHHTAEYELEYDFGEAPLLEIHEVKNYTSLIGPSESYNSNLLLSAGEKINYSQALNSGDGWGSLMLADVMVRSITKEKYEQNCVVASSSILEKTIALNHLEQKVKDGLQKMSLLFGDLEAEGVEFSPEKGVWRW